jgi:hypothetical protein
VVAVLAAEVDAEPEVAPPLPDAEVTAPLLLVETLVPPTPFANPPPDVSPGLVEPPKPSAPGVPKSEESSAQPVRSMQSANPATGGRLRMLMACRISKGCASRPRRSALRTAPR